MTRPPLDDWPAPRPPGTAPRSERVAARVRWLAVRGGASAITGVVVLGIGGRLVMLASRLLHPDAVGRLTENGNRIGDVTVGGTIGLVFFGGLLGGVFAGFIWAIGREWLSDRPFTVGVAAVALGGGGLVEADNRDFVVLQDPAVDIALLLGLLLVFGIVLVLVDRWLDDVVPRDGQTVTLVSAGAVALASPLAIPLLGSYFTSEFCQCDDPPVLTGVFLVVAGAAAVWGWLDELRGPRESSPWVQRVGAAALAAAVIVAGSELALEVQRILG